MVEAVQTTESLTVKATGVSVNIFGSYTAKVIYRYHCLRSTSLGTEILYTTTWQDGVKLVSMLKAANKWAEQVSWIVGVLYLVLAICVCAKALDPAATAYCAIVGIAIKSIAFLIDLLAFFAIGMWMPLAWDAGLVFKVSAIDQNEFFTIERGQRVEILSSDLSTYALYACLDATQSIKVMVYGNTWKQQNIYGCNICITLPAVGFWVSALVCAFMIDVTNPLGLASCYDLWLPALVWAALWALLFVLAVVHQILKCVFLIFDLILCHLPTKGINKLREGVREKVIKRVGESKGTSHRLSNV